MFRFSHLDDALPTMAPTPVTNTEICVSPLIIEYPFVQNLPQFPYDETPPTLWSCLSSGPHPKSHIFLNCLDRSPSGIGPCYYQQKLYDLVQTHGGPVLRLQYDLFFHYGLMANNNYVRSPKRGQSNQQHQQLAGSLMTSSRPSIGLPLFDRKLFHSGNASISNPTHNSGNSMPTLHIASRFC